MYKKRRKVPLYSRVKWLVFLRRECINFISTPVDTLFCIINETDTAGESEKDPELHGNWENMAH